MHYFALGSVLLLASVQLTLAKTIEVIVGGPGVLKFNPQSVTADRGDTVRFIFQQKNHTVTQSTLANPCSPLAGGFDSKFMPAADNQTRDFLTAELVVSNTTTPIWAYCRQGTHCKSGMVFAINANATAFDAFRTAATGGTPASPPSVSSTSASVPTSTGIPSSTDHKIIVGGTDLVFNPANITAQVGDTITFEFHQKNHTVTASSFDEPCRGLAQGFDSDFKPVPAGSTNFPTYVVQVNDTKPIWAFCKQGNHCSQSGMVFAANTVESSSNTFAAFQARAKGSSSSTTGYPSSAWRPTVGSSSMAVILGLFAAGWLL